jgi:hypothetical protein
MSTKLYTGIKFKSNKLSTVIRQLNGLKEEAKENVMKTFRREGEHWNFIALVNLYENAIKNGKKVENKWDLMRILNDELRKRNSEFWFEFGVTIFERKNKLYGVYYDLTHNNYKMLFNRDIAVDYHYQDQTDKPDEVSNKNWNFREKVWKDIFDDISCLWMPKEAGVVYEIICADDIELTNEIFDEVVKFSTEYKNKKEEENVL